MHYIENSMKIAICTTVPCTLGFISEIVANLKKNDHEVIIISSDESELRTVADGFGVNYICIPFYRGMNPLKDLKAIALLAKELKQAKPDMVVGATPKAAMVSMIAARSVRVPIRIYHIYGLTYETAHGLMLRILKTIETITGNCATHIVPIGNSVKESTLKNKLYPSRKFIQIGQLTVGGVDPKRFDPDKLKEDRKLLRDQLGITDEDFVIGYVARFTYDKGFCDLIDIWNRIQQDDSLHLLIAGEMDERAPMDKTMLEEFFKHPRVHNMGNVADIERIFSAMDTFLFPSYREGFGNVNIEASSMRIPVISYDVTGCKDAVTNEVSGYTVPFKDYDTVISKIHQLHHNPSLRFQLGNNGRQIVLNNFTCEIVASNFASIIDAITKKHK